MITANAPNKAESPSTRRVAVATPAVALRAAAAPSAPVAVTAIPRASSRLAGRFHHLIIRVSATFYLNNVICREFFETGEPNGHSAAQRRRFGGEARAATRDPL